MPKRKFLSRILTRYRRKLIREESDGLFNEESRTNSYVILNNSASDNDHDEIVNFNHATSEIKQEAINLPFFDLTNISASDISLNNVSLHREDNITEDNIREDNNSEKENNDFKAFLVLSRIVFFIFIAFIVQFENSTSNLFQFPKMCKDIITYTIIFHYY